MPKYFTFILMALILGCSDKKTGTGKKDAIPQKIDTLKYSYEGFNNGSKLSLLSDGRFINVNYVYGCFGGGERKKVSGTYNLDSTLLTLFPKKVEFIQYPEDITSKPKITESNYGPDSLKIKTEFKIITWNRTKYLLSAIFDYGWNIELENDFVRFAYYLNAGLEPDDHGMYLVSEEHKLDTLKNPFDLNGIPDEWRCFFLEKPIAAKIISAKKVTHPFDDESTTWLVELNQGENMKITEGLSFQGRDGNFLMDVTKVLKNRSYGYFYYEDLEDKKLPIGMEVRTKW